MYYQLNLVSESYLFWSILFITLPATITPTTTMYKVYKLALVFFLKPMNFKTKAYSP